MSEAILQTQELTRRYGHTLALDRASITVEKGQIFGLVGRNGAGKTTLIRLISGQSIPTSGQISLFGQTSDSGLNRARSLTGAMVEIPSFYPYLTARQNLEYYRIQRGIPGKNCVDEALELVNLTDTGKKKFKTFSLGMKQRLGLALALMNQPEFLLLDEPINGLDPEGIVEFRELLLRLNRERQTTIFISSHILRVVRSGHPLWLHRKGQGAGDHFRGQPAGKVPGVPGAHRGRRPSGCPGSGAAAGYPGL